MAISNQNPPKATGAPVQPKVMTKPVAKASAPAAEKIAVAPKPAAPLAAQNLDPAPVAATKAVVAEPTPAPRVESKPAPAAPAAAITKETPKMTNTVNKIEDTAKKNAAEMGEKANEMFKDVQGRAKVAFEKTGETMKDVVEFHKSNLEAVVASGKIAAQGAQTAAQNAAEFGRKNWEATTSFAKNAAAVKAPTDFFRLQGEFVRGQFDAAVAEFSRSTEFYLKLAGEVAQPMQNRFAATGEMLKARMAA